MKKGLKILLIVIVVIVLVMALLRFNPIDFSGEGSWIKDSRDVYIKHGNPSETLDYVKEQQTVVSF